MRSDHTAGVNPIEGPEILQVVTALEDDVQCVEDLGAINLWLARSEVPIEAYLQLWSKSCTEIHSTGKLPARSHAMLLPK
jgi:hypothetical protein